MAPDMPLLYQTAGTIYEQKIDNIIFMNVIFLERHERTKGSLYSQLLMIHGLII